MKGKISTQTVATVGLVAALYTMVYFLFAPLSSGLLQLRVAEAFTLLAVFSPSMVAGVTLGCGLSNLLGFALGVNPLIWDVIIGTVATGLAGILSYQLREFRIKGYPLFSALPPILINGIFIGIEIAWLTTGWGSGFFTAWLLSGIYVSAAQLLPCLVLGPLLVAALEKTNLPQKHLL